MESERFKELREKAIDAAVRLSGSDFEDMLNIPDV